MKLNSILPLREEQELRVSQNEVLRWMSGPKIVERIA
jgi:intein-encoded DNA endonuclease-like protein